MSTMDDRFAILEMIARYSYTYDARDADGFAELFAPDAHWEYYLVDQAEPEIRLKSREEIRSWAKERLAGRQGVLISRHHQSSTVFDVIQADYAETRTMVLVTHHEFDQPHPIPTLSGVYYDTWGKTDGGWKYQTRILKTDRFPS